MKIRNGFVSNSSSSSFIIVGFTDDTYMKQIAEKDGKFEDGEYRDVECNYGVDDSCALTYYGSYGEPYYIGIDISKKIENKILPELRKELKDKVKDEYGLDIPLDKIKLFYGEVGDG